MNNWFEIFKVGKHTDSSGTVKEWTEKDLDKIVAQYNGQKEHEAPIVVGHPADNSPAYGWIEKLKRVGDTLLALPKQVVAEFAEAVKKGMYKKRSISLYPDGTLRHVGFLGAVPPAVKGLEDIKFATNKYKQLVYEFEEVVTEEAGEPEKKEEPTDEVKALNDKIAKLEEKIAQLSGLVESNADLKTKFEEMQKQKEDAIELADVKAKKVEFESFLTEKLNAGNLVPAQIEKIKELLSTLEGIQDFSETNPRKLLKVVVANYKELIETFPKLVPKIPDEANKEKHAPPDKTELEEFSDRMASYVNTKKKF